MLLESYRHLQVVICPFDLVSQTAGFVQPKSIPAAEEILNFPMWNALQHSEKSVSNNVTE